ncbi:MAG: alpha/beta hydrolase [Acetivibrionales bacterium]
MRISGVTYVSHKTYWVRKLLVVLLLLAFIAVLTIALISAYAGWKLVHPKSPDIKPFSSNIAPEYINVSFKSRDESIVLSGWLFNSGDSSKTVILAHGYGQNRLPFGEQTLDIIKSFEKQGYNVLTFDFRNSGKSDGKVSSMGFYEKDDLLGAIDYVKSLGAQQIVLMGFSTGASTCILAASDSNEIDAIIADSPFLNLEEYISYIISRNQNLPRIPFSKTIMLSIRLLAGIDADKTSPQKNLESITGIPILFIHSKDDNGISSDSSSRLYNIYSKEAVDKAELWITEGTDHAASYTQSPVEYMQRVFTFLDKVLDKGADE